MAEISKNTIITVPYNYDEILAILKEEAISSGLVTDTDYEGSNIAQVCRLLAYTAQSANVNLTKAVNESLISRTSDYTLAYKIAKQLGYLPKGKTSYVYTVKIEPINQGYYKIPQFTSFKSKDKKYYYMGKTIERKFEYFLSGQSVDSSNNVINTPTFDFENNEYFLKKGDHIVKILSVENIDPTKSKYILDHSGDSEELITLEDTPAIFQVISDNNILYYVQSEDFLDTMIEEIDVKEGKLYRYYDETYNPEGERNLVHKIERDKAGNPINYIDLDYRDIENEGIELYITYFDNDNTLHILEKWEQRSSFLLDRNNITESKTFLPIVDENTMTLRLYFKYAGTGVTPRVGSKVFINLLESHGSKGAADILKLDTLSAKTWKLESYKLKVTGSEEESLESIKTNTMTYNNTANRAVTEKDYIAVASSLPGVKFANAFGGDNHIPNKLLGYVFVMFYMDYFSNEFSFNDILFERKINEEEFNALDTEIYGENSLISKLNDYKVITIQIKALKNVYIDTEIEIHIKNYLPALPISDQNNNMFNILKDYFLSSEEKYNNRLFISNYIRLLDNLFGDNSGIEIKPKFSAILNKHSIYESIPINGVSEKFIDFYLKMPVDGYINNRNELIMEKIFQITSDNLTINSHTGKIYIQKLYKKYTNNNVNYYIGDERFTELNIRLGNSSTPTYRDGNNVIDNNTDLIIGKCYIDNILKIMLFRFFINDLAFPESHLNDGNIKLEITLNNNTLDEIGVFRNTLLRLKSVKFI